MFGPETTIREIILWSQSLEQYWKLNISKSYSHNINTYEFAVI